MNGLGVIAYRDDYQAGAIANDSPYGLMAFISSTNKERANKIASQLKAGHVLINTLKHDPIAPLGEYKDSGAG